MVRRTISLFCSAVVALALVSSFATEAGSRAGQITDQIISTRAISPGHTYATFDSATNTGGTLSNGNLTFTVVGAGNTVRASIYSQSQKGYGEFKIVACTCGAGNLAIGVVLSTQATSSPTSIATVPVGMWLWRDDAIIMNNGAFSALGAAPALNDIINVAFDPVAGNLWIGKNGTWFGSGNPSTGANPSATGVTGSVTFIVNFQATGGTPSILANYGPTFTNTVPAGFGPL